VTGKKRESSAVKKARLEAIAALEQLGGKHFTEDKLIFEGDKLILPTNMSISDAIKFLNQKMADDEQHMDFHRSFEYRPWDVAYCTQRAMQRYFGAFLQKSSTSMGFFGPEVSAPKQIHINIGPNETVNVPWGDFTIPFLPDVQFSMAADRSKTGIIGQIYATGPKKRAAAVEGVFRLIEKELKESSIYQGKAFDAQENPEFLDLSHVDPSKIVFSETTKAQLDANLWSPIIYREQTDQLGMPFKRAVLLSGDFGVGKTLALNRTGQIATEEGITFILVRPGRDNLTDAINTAKMYQPAIVAFEDVEVVAGPDQDDRSVSQVLDLFDGIESKNSQIMLVLTSNHVDKLHKGVLRPGRLDAVIHIGTPDQQGITRLVRNTVGDDRLADKIDWQTVAESMDLYLPAFVVEAAQRSLRYALVRTEGVLDGTKIDTMDLVNAANGLRPHFELMQEARTGAKEKNIEQALIETIHRAELERMGEDLEPGETARDAVRRASGY